MTPDQILVVNYGSQYSRLITRRIRELGVYSELVPHTAKADVCGKNTKGIVLSGGPESVFAKNAPTLPEWIVKKDLPVLGICYGMHLLVNRFGGGVRQGKKSEYGSTAIQFTESDALFRGLEAPTSVWMSHGDSVLTLPAGFEKIAWTHNSEHAAFRKNDRYWGIQFHPEVTHTVDGRKIIENFVVTGYSSRTATLRCPHTYLVTYL